MHLTRSIEGRCVVAKKCRVECRRKGGENRRRAPSRPMWRNGDFSHMTHRNTALRHYARGIKAARTGGRAWTLDTARMTASHTTGTWGVIVGEEDTPRDRGRPATPFPLTASCVAPCISHAPRRNGIASDIAGQSGKVYAKYKLGILKAN